MKNVLIVLCVLCSGCLPNGEIFAEMNENNPVSLVEAKKILFTFEDRNAVRLEEALETLFLHEKPEYFEIERIGEDEASSGFFQRYHFKKLGILIEKKDEKIINAREVNPEE